MNENFEGMDKEKLFESFLLFQSFMNMNNTINNLAKSREGLGNGNTTVQKKAEIPLVIEKINIEIANNDKKRSDEKRNKLMNMKDRYNHIDEPERDVSSGINNIVSNSDVNNTNSARDNIITDIRPVDNDNEKFNSIVLPTTGGITIIKNNTNNNARVDNPDERPIKGISSYQTNDKLNEEVAKVTKRKTLVKLADIPSNPPILVPDSTGFKFDELPIKPATNNFLDLLEKNLANDNVADTSNKEVKKIVKKPRFKKIINISTPLPNEAKKYKYYSDNFDGNNKGI
jgi:hypothetical protein